MSKKFIAFALQFGIIALAFAGGARAQTTSGLITGTITDSTGAVIPGTQVLLTSQGTGVQRSSVTDANGYYSVPELPPGVYDVSVSKEGFANQKLSNVHLEVNQSEALNFKMSVTASTQTVQVNADIQQINTTSATRAEVVSHTAIVELPLNGRQFNQLTLLTPGAVPLVQGGQQGAFTVKLGAGSVSPSVDGQRPQQNNYTMDGVLNNALFTNTFAISPPPDAIQEFNVQSHITDAQFAISSGANINLVSRSGTNDFHGAVYEFIRNNVLDANTYPATSDTPYKQNQYGLFVGGPIIKNHTFFSGYWEGFRSEQTQSYLSATLTDAMRGGDFSSVLGTTPIGIDDLGRPEYANEIYDPYSTTPDPKDASKIIRNPYPNNTIPTEQLNPAALAILDKYYPSPNLNVAAGALPNYAFNGNTSTKADQVGVRIDHQFNQNNTVFFRFNRSNNNVSSPEGFPGYTGQKSNYSRAFAGGYTHIFSPNTILNIRYGYTETSFNIFDQPAGTDFLNALNFTETAPVKNDLPLGPGVGVANGYTGVSQFAAPVGPQKNSDYHADLSKIVGNHTIGVGGMYYRIHSFDDGWQYTMNFTQNGTSVDASQSGTGYGPASLLVGTPDSYTPWVGDTSEDQKINWYGFYAQDQWRILKNLVLSYGLRYDYITPPKFAKINSGLDVLSGIFQVTGPVPPLFPKAVGPSSYYYKQTNGWQPRFGFVYQPHNRTAIQGAFVIIDDHNNTLIEEQSDIRLSWPSGIYTTISNQDLGYPSVFINTLPAASTFLDPNKPLASFGGSPHPTIPYSMEWNLGVEQQLTQTMVLGVHYVASGSRHQFLQPLANTATVPGPGPISARQPYPQYGGPIPWDYNEGTANYNGLQVKLKQELAHGLYYLLSYTYGKSMDLASDPQADTITNFYNLAQDYGPSDYSRKHMLSFAASYALPVGHGQAFLTNANPVVNTILGGWNIGGIFSADSGLPFSAMAGGDVANTGGGPQRAQRNANASGSAPQTRQQWLNPQEFTVPAPFTFGNELRNDLIGPGYLNVDFNARKDFKIERFTTQFKAEFFNLFNRTQLGLPNNNVQSSAFGSITSSSASAREIQFGLKVLF
jgi:Carboxypeptidase regulatory-like domain/TonB dependent receptor-like, beta-barrel